jgi:hypothetical protein
MLATRRELLARKHYTFFARELVQRIRVLNDDLRLLNGQHSRRQSVARPSTRMVLRPKVYFVNSH